VPEKWPSAKIPLPIGKFPEGSLPRAALGKAFAEGLIAFAEGRKPSAKILSAVVMCVACVPLYIQVFFVYIIYIQVLDIICRAEKN